MNNIIYLTNAYTSRGITINTQTVITNLVIGVLGKYTAVVQYRFNKLSIFHFKLLKNGLCTGTCFRRWKLCKPIGGLSACRPCSLLQSYIIKYKVLWFSYSSHV